jgi:hypothetical protein
VAIIGRAGDYTQCPAIRHRPLRHPNEALRVLTYRTTPRHAVRVTFFAIYWRKVGYAALRGPAL